MEDIGSIFGIIIFIVVVWALFYFVARILGDSYDKKPLKYKSVEKTESDNVKNGKFTENEKDIQRPVSNKKSFWTGIGGYITGGLVYTFAQSFNKSSADGIIIVIIAIASWVCYYRIKSKIKVKNEVVKVILTFFIIEIIAGLSTGILTSLADGLIK